VTAITNANPKAMHSHELQVQKAPNASPCSHQVVQAEVCDSIAQDRLLDEQHVAAAGLDLLDHAQDVVALLLVHAVHLQPIQAAAAAGVAAARRRR
jgi:hypothetical protein